MTLQIESASCLLPPGVPTFWLYVFTVFTLCWLSIGVLTAGLLVAERAHYGARPMSEAAAEPSPANLPLHPHRLGCGCSVKGRVAISLGTSGVIFAKVTLRPWVLTFYKFLVRSCLFGVR